MRVCLVVAILVAGVSGAYNNNKISENENNSTDRQRYCTDEICLTPACIHTASRVLSYMDRSVNPCDGFYSFACGEFQRTTNIPDEKKGVTSFTLLQDIVSKQLRSILEEPLQDTEIRPVKLAKKLYKACLNTTLLEERGLDPIKDVVKGLGGWPLLEDAEWNSTDSWVQTVNKLKNFGMGIDVYLDNLIYPTRNMIVVDVVKLGMSDGYVFENKRAASYNTYQTDIVVMLGANRERAAREMKETLQFEMELANIMTAYSAEGIDTAQLMSLEEMQTKFPSIQWLDYINTIVPESVQVNASEEVIVIDPDFITKLEALLATADARVVANYVFWRVVQSMVPSSTRDMRAAALKYDATSSQNVLYTSRWKQCTVKVAESLKLVISSMYVKRFFNETSKQAALEMVEDIRETIKDVLTNLDWMDQTTKEKALLKAKSMKSFIAYPGELLDDNKVEEFYKMLEVDESKYLESMLNVTTFLRYIEFSPLRQPVNETDWISRSNIVEVRTDYTASENSIEFPDSVLQGVYFNSLGLKHLNYGAFGYMIGHEMSHGFEHEGSQVDSAENLDDWWSPDTREKFSKMAACITEQYGNYTEPITGRNLNGERTQRENIADNRGIQVAYKAYERWSKQQGAPEQRLPGLEWLTPQQMVWVSRAQIECDKSTPEVVGERLTWLSSPPQFRVDGSFSNAEEFARDFSCPAGSKMNPAQRCKVW